MDVAPTTGTNVGFGALVQVAVGEAGFAILIAAPPAPPGNASLILKFEIATGFVLFKVMVSVCGGPPSVSTLEGVNPLVIVGLVSALTLIL